MGSQAQIDQRTVPVNGRGGSIRNLGLDEVLLVLAVLEHLQQVLLRDLKTLKLLLLLNSLLRKGLERLQVGRLNGASLGDSHIVEETIVSRRAVGEVATESLFARLSENVGGRMPEDLLGCLMSEPH